MRRLLTMCAALTVVGAVTVSAHAGWMTDFAGNGYFRDPANPTTNPANAPFLSANVSAAVWETQSSGDFQTGVLDSLGISATFDGGSDFNAAYIYLYQVVNTDLAAENRVVSAFMLPIVSEASVQAFGYLEDAVFNEPGVGAVGGSNVGLGTNSTTDGGFESYAPPTSPNEATMLTTNGSATGLSLGDTYLDTPVPGGQSYIRFDFLSNLLDGQTSTIFFMTSNVAPTFTSTAMVNDSGFDSDGKSITSTPVPAGLALVFTGLPGILGMFFWRRKQAVVA